MNHHKVLHSRGPGPVIISILFIHLCLHILPLSSTQAILDTHKPSLAVKPQSRCPLILPDTMIVTIPPSEDEPLYCTRGGILIHPA